MTVIKYYYNHNCKFLWLDVSYSTVFTSAQSVDYHVNLELFNRASDTSSKTVFISNGSLVSEHSKLRSDLLPKNSGSATKGRTGKLYVRRPILGGTHI